MRTWGVAAAGVVAALVAGCGGGEAVSTEPLPTDGPNQVVIKVPTMT